MKYICPRCGGETFTPEQSDGKRTITCAECDLVCAEGWDFTEASDE